MREVFASAAAWLAEGRNFALATLVALRESATAPVGTTIAVATDGSIAGNIGAGCHETEIVEAAARTAADGRSRRLDVNLTIEDELMGTAGCGAIMQVVAWRPEPAFREEALAIAAGDRDARFSFDYEAADGSMVAFEHVFRAKQRLILIGATALAAELATIGRRVDFEVIVVDPRPAFATPERVPNAHEIVREWPQDYLPGALSARTSIVMLSHDPKFDLPALRCALRSEAPYIGLLGSRRTQAARRAALSDDGFDEATLARIHGPAGLDIGGASVAETAISILSEIVAARYDRIGVPLRSTSRAIHRRPQTTARAVILAAGTSSRAGSQKLLMAFRGRTLLDYAIDAAARWKPVVVAGAEVDAYLAGRSDVEVVRNEDPHRGMSHSLALASRAVPEEQALIVLLGDKPLVTESLIESIANAAGDGDVVYPVNAGVPGHPVVLSPVARRFIAALPDGDTLRFLRERPDLRARALPTSDAGAFFDVDTVSALRERTPER